MFQELLKFKFQISDHTFIGYAYFIAIQAIYSILDLELVHYSVWPFISHYNYTLVATCTALTQHLITTFHITTHENENCRHIKSKTKILD